MDLTKLKRESLCVQAGWQPKNGEARVLPVFQSTTFKYDDTEQMADLFDLKASGYFYTRLQNPTNDAVASKIAALEGGVAGMLTSSGQAANFYSIFIHNNLYRHTFCMNTIIPMHQCIYNGFSNCCYWIICPIFS